MKIFGKSSVDTLRDRVEHLEVAVQQLAATVAPLTSEAHLQWQKVDTAIKRLRQQERRLESHSEADVTEATEQPAENNPFLAYKNRRQRRR